MMDYQHLQKNQIKNLDYMGLINMLMNQISPEIRAVVLERLTEMNNQLLVGNQINIQTDLARSGMLNFRKKEMTELQHPSWDKLKNPSTNFAPVQFSSGSYENSFYQDQETRNMAANENLKSRNDFKSRENPIPLDLPINSNNYQNNQTNNLNHFGYSSKRNYQDIDLDDIINEITSKPNSGFKGNLTETLDVDNLDIKLSQIKKLHQKLLTEKRQKKREK